MIGDKIIRLPETTSSNTYAEELIMAEKPEEGTVIIAYSQTHGKGQRGNTWESQAGKNLTSSIILYPIFLKPEKQFQLNKCISLAVLDFIKLHIPAKMSPKIKWPNDIYVGNLKIAGILIENTIMNQSILHSIVGIGININQEHFESKVINPTSLKLITQKDYNIDECLTELSFCMNKRYAQLKTLSDLSINHDYIDHLYRMNIPSAFRNKNGIFTAKITGVTEQGRLCLCDSENHVSDYAFKEIEFII